MFLRNSWYVAAWAKDLERTLLSRTILGEPLVFYRKENGDPVALEDRCAHRHAPLHLGRLVGDDLQCDAMTPATDSERSNAPGHHHFSWDVGTVDEIGECAMHMLDKGFSKGWGLGRHVLGSNFFHYVQDPWGSFCEYSADIDYVPVDCDWPSGDHPAEDSFYAWGPNVPEDFVHNYEAWPAG